MFWPFNRRRRSRLDVVEAEAAAALQCQRVHAVRVERACIVRDRLMAVVPAEARERIQAKLDQAAAVRGAA